MANNNKDNRDLYELFNDMSFNEGEFEPIEMNEIEAARLKKLVRERISIDEPKKEIPNEKISLTQSNKKNRNWLKIASIVAVITIAAGFTPRGREVLAQIADKLFFNPSQGIMSEEQWGNTYVLEEPVRVNINGVSTLIKNIINSGDYISIEMWTDEAINENNPNFKEEYESLSDKKYKDLKENFKIKTMTNKMLQVEGASMASGGYSAVSFKPEEDIITEFYLYYGEEEIGYFQLKQIRYVDGYDELGGNATNKGILIGATSYYLEGERYFKLWSNKDGLELPEYRMNIDSYNDIVVKDENGNTLKFESANDGTGKAYKLLEDYKGDIHVSIKDIDLSYELREGSVVSLKLPKKGETDEFNKEIKLNGLKDRVVIKAITSNNGQYENGDYIITLDFSNNYDDSRSIYMATERFRSGGSMGDPENKCSEIYLDKEDLRVSERLLGRIKLKLDGILVKQYGNWEFEVK